MGEKQKEHIDDKPKSIQDLIDEIKETYYDFSQEAFIDAMYMAKCQGLVDVQKEIEKRIQELASKRVGAFDLLSEGNQIRICELRDLHGGFE